MNNQTSPLKTAGEETLLLCDALPHVEIADDRKRIANQFLGAKEGPQEDARLAASIAFGPPIHPSLYAYTSAYGDRIKFRTFTNVDFRVALSERYEHWSELFWKVKNSAINTERWDDVWYWNHSFQPNDIVMIACNIDANRYAAVTLRNGTYWDVFRSNAYPDPIRISNGQKMKFPYTVGGSKVEFDLWNPENSGDWTPNDMIISWGRP